MKSIIKQFIPPIFFKLLRMFNKNPKYGWHGNYQTWHDAQSQATGYDSSLILEKVCASLLKVKNGEAIYERDSVVFDEIQYSWQLLAGLMYAASKNNGNLNILDFGGSLGSTYFQNRKFLNGLKSINWSIVEQGNFVNCGKQYFADNTINFYDDINVCIKEQKPNILLLSSVLQYIENPYELLDELLEHKFDLILIDRTPFAKNDKDTITLQTVPPEIYTASYPCWLFSETNFTSKLSNYQMIESFYALDGETDTYIFKGFILEK